MANEQQRPDPEQSWHKSPSTLFDRTPLWLRGLIIVWGLMSILFVAVDDLHDGAPRWLSLTMTAPYLVVVLGYVLPALIAKNIRRLGWLGRKVVTLFRR